jgi:hypothetical protein
MNEKIENRYIKYTEKLEFKPLGFVSKLISRLLPNPDPDFDDLYRQVHFWYLEIDPKFRMVSREIGFDENARPIVFGPFKSNRGLWIDAPVKFNADDFENTSQDEFEKHWNYLREKFNTTG